MSTAVYALAWAVAAVAVGLRVVLALRLALCGDPNAVARTAGLQPDPRRHTGPHRVAAIVVAATWVWVAVLVWRAR